ncbi:MAG TPA: 16S rRNA (adenine(1518)-N(6)/adenine(1519)-N(6))-dimethyltransferase RsmA [Acidimicrobiia bacterium]|nr:16S rRNA (adenine(1518)-N(6)/adenine(1519)-N(6))-dimethyltransferase RsmA [Acidimicrobiia bacterium]
MSAENPLGRAATARLLAAHGVRPSKDLGQHFLADPNLVRKIVIAAEVWPGDRVLEIGAGAGTLTRGLAATGASVLAYEVDTRLRPVLEEALAGVAGVEVRYADAALIDPAELAGEDWVMVANLPYHVGTPLLLRLLREAPAISRFVVMLQREAVERLAAPPGSRTYGLPSVVVQLHGRVKIAFRVPPTVFLPPPKVESAVVVIHRQPAHPSTERAIALAAAAFGQRRKMLRRSLASVLTDPAAALAAAGLEATRRAEDLAPEDYLRLAEVAGGG